MTTRFLVPEVVQTSNMDCGPASLKALLAGFGIEASYGRLREACQTEVDGTSIDTLEDVAGQLGLDAEQVLTPPDHVLLPEAEALPAIVVVRQPNGETHFVVAWRRVGPWVQVMDPAIGRRWVPVARFLADLYVHAMPVPAAAFADWVASEEFDGALARRLAAIGCARDGRALLATASGHRDRAALDAAVRFAASVVRSGGVAPGREASAVLTVAYEDARARGDEAIAKTFWTALPAPPSDDGEEQVLMRGAVLVRVAGLRARDGERPPLSPELARALAEPAPQPWRTLLGLLGGDGAAGGALAASLVGATCAAALGGVLEALLLRGVFNLGRELGVVQQRLGAVSALLVFLALLLAVETPAAWGISRLGRRLETRLRVAFLAKIPRLGDRYFSSRPVSDMAERCHAGQRVRVLPDIAAQTARLVLEILVTVAGIAWLDATSAPFAVLAAATAIGVALAVQPVLSERDMKTRTHEGALARFYLDAMLGLSPVRTHGAERSVARAHEGLLVEWARSARAMVSAYVGADLLQSAVGTVLALVLLYRYVHGAGDATGVILLVYWALALPMLGQELGVVLRQVPGHRNTTLRLLEPLGAMEEAEREPGATLASDAAAGRSVGAAALAFEGVDVVAGGHTILEDVSLAVAPGEHVAIVGASGAGKSSLVGLLLGWHRPSRGRVLVDGEPLEGARVGSLREATAWVDPAVQLWNRSLVDNLLYGGPRDAPSSLGRVIDAAELTRVLERLPDGMQTALGEGGGLVSGGEGQRVRLARGLLRHEARLVLLDEPFRGLDRDRRRALLARARAWWHGATVLCITHDVGETAGFSRVLVIEGGRVVEDGAPAELMERPSRYRELVLREREVLRDVWEDPTWRRLALREGRLTERSAGSDPEEPAARVDGAEARA